MGEDRFVSEAGAPSDTFALLVISRATPTDGTFAAGPTSVLVWPYLTARI